MKSQFFFLKTVLQSRTQEPVEENSGSQKHIFQCPFDGCTATYLQYHNLQKHVLAGKHKLSPDKKTLNDYAINTFGAKIEEKDKSRFMPRLAEAVESTFPMDYENDVVLAPGWGLRESKSRVLYSATIKTFIKQIYEKSLKDKRKLDPKIVAALLRKAKRSNGAPMFTNDEILNWRQVSSYLARLGKERTREKRSSDGEPMEIDEAEYDEYESGGDDQLDFMKEPGTQYYFDYVHQIVYDKRHEIFEYADDPIVHEEL